VATTAGPSVRHNTSDSMHSDHRVTQWPIGRLHSVSQSVVKQIGAAHFYPDRSHNFFTWCGRATLTPILEYLVTEPPLKSDGTPRYAAPAAKVMLSRLHLRAWSVNQPYYVYTTQKRCILIISFFSIQVTGRARLHSDTRPSSQSPATRTRADRVNRSLVPDRALFFRPLVTVIREGVICRCLTDGPHKRTRHPQFSTKERTAQPHVPASLSTCDGPQNESGQRGGATRRQCSGDQ
jgi:hypothetical protein